MGGFVRRFALTFGLVFGLTATIAYAVDPYGYWGRPRIEGFNYWKPYSFRHLRDTKPRQHRWIRPRTVIAGNSRVEAGFDPESTAWPTTARPIYNYGIRGAGMETVSRSLIAAIDEARPDRIYLGVDFTDFLVSQAVWRSAAHPAPASDSGLVDHMGVAARTLVSLDALKDSVNTVLGQDPNSRHLTPLGFNPLHHFTRMVSEEGPHSMFATTLRQTRDRYDGRGTHVSWPGPGGNPAWHALERLADRARERDVELVLFTYPFRPEVLKLFGDLGLDPARAEWACELGEFARRERLTVWNFTDVAPAVAEPVPPPDGRRPMRYWWEIGHFRSSLGDLMIERMTEGRGSFGAPLAAEPAAGCQPKVQLSGLAGR